MQDQAQRRPVADHRTWHPEADIVVELRRRGSHLQTGRVEAVMPDRSGFWLAAHGPDQRRYVDLADEDLEIWA